MTVVICTWLQNSGLTGGAGRRALRPSLLDRRVTTDQTGRARKGKLRIDYSRIKLRYNAPRRKNPPVRA
eukprot:7384383-Prymnesium_polylepis.2